MIKIDHNLSEAIPFFSNQISNWNFDIFKYNKGCSTWPHTLAFHFLKFNPWELFLH